MNGIAGAERRDRGDRTRHRAGTSSAPTGSRGSSRTAVDVALNGATREIDLGRVPYRSWAGADEARWFANVASVGMSGAIAQRANETSKALGGRISYLLATLTVFARWQVGDVRVSVDDEIRGGRMHDVIVANGRYFGGGMMICPEAEPDDGLFDVLLIGA